jgi:hypothetical protein
MDGFGGTIWGTAPTWQVASTGIATGVLLGLTFSATGGWILFFPIAVGIGWAAWRTGRLRALPWVLLGLGLEFAWTAVSRGGTWTVAAVVSLVLAAVSGAVLTARRRSSAASASSAS